MHGSLSRRSFVVALAATVFLVACSSPIEVRRATFGEGEQVSAGIGDDWTKGVPFYLPVREPRRFVLTKRKLSEDGSRVTRRCERVFGVESAVVADYSQLYLIRHNDFFFGSNTLGVTLKDGILVSVNSVRDPQVDEMVGALAGLAKEAGALAADESELAQEKGEEDLPDCDTGKRILPN